MTENTWALLIVCITVVLLAAIIADLIKAKIGATSKESFPLVRSAAGAVESMKAFSKALEEVESGAAAVDEISGALKELDEEDE